MSTTDKLRQAARVLRERAEAATPGPWYWEPPSPDDWPSADESLMSSVNDEPVLTGWGYDASGITASDGDRAYIATMHPGVGGALADWLDAQARHVGSYYCDQLCEPDGCDETKAALILADLILGSQP